MTRSLHRNSRLIALHLPAAVVLAAAVAGSSRFAAAQAAPRLEPSAVRLEAERLLLEGKPFRATRLLAPLLGTPAGRDPGFVLLAARAAAGWEGWGTVERLLATQSWLDELADGEGRALLARARVERSEPAVADARRAVAAARGDALGPRLLTLARAYDRSGFLDSAATTYLQAERLLPEAKDWLRLRAAGVLADSAARAALYGALALPAAVARIRWTEALARDRTGDWRQAARLYDGLDAALIAARIRLRAARAPAELITVRRELVALLTARPPPAPSVEDARAAIALLDEAFPNLSAEEELVVARRAATMDPVRAARGFARASGSNRLADPDQLSYGSVLTRLGRHQEARGLLAAVKSRELRAQAQYLRARSLLASGLRTAAIGELRQLALTAEDDSATAATAGYLAADLLVDDGDEKGARQAYLDVASRFPRTSHGARAALQAALLAWVHGDRVAAAREFAALAERAGETPEGIAALYWSGRSLHAAGDTQTAASRWRELLERFPASYYTVPAAERLGVPPLRERPPTLVALPDSGVLSSLDRAAVLERLGLRVEARFEYERIARQAETTPSILLGTARAFYQRGQIGRAYRLAARSAAAPEQLTFPLPGPEVMDEARENEVDPLLAAALIRQESAFDPSARSRADARGLMQVLPGVGAGMAPAAGIGEWDPALLYQPDVNAHFGMAYLARTLRRYPKLPAALAAYNAGDRPSNRWLALPGAADDPEVFIERIGYVETRDYVRRVLRSLATYRALYPTIP